MGIVTDSCLISTRSMIKSSYGSETFGKLIVMLELALPHDKRFIAVIMDDFRLQFWDLKQEVKPRFGT